MDERERKAILSEIERVKDCVVAAENDGDKMLAEYGYGYLKALRWILEDLPAILLGEDMAKCG